METRGAVGTSLIIEQVPEDEWKRYKALRLEILQEEPIAFEDPEAAIVLYTSWQEPEWRSFLTGKSQRHANALVKAFWARLGAEIVGTTLVAFFEEDGVKIARLHNVYVPKKFRGQGIARKLLETVLAKIQSYPELSKIKLNVYTTQSAAIALYQSVGFTVVLKEKAIREHQGQKLDNYKMELDPADLP